MNLSILMDELKALRDMDHDSPYISHFIKKGTVLRHKQVCWNMTSHFDLHPTVSTNIFVQVKVT